MYYEVRAYKTQSDYDNRMPATVIDDITNKRDALKEARLWVPDHAVVKVQSDDREFIQIMKG